MMANSQLVPREIIRAELAGSKADLTDNAVEVQVGRLRRKLGPDWIKTVRGLGYRLEPVAVSSAGSIVHRDLYTREETCGCDEKDFD